MKINSVTRQLIEKSVLCWLATSGEDNFPNVAPKEMFIVLNDKIIIAQIASPNSIKNIKQNDKVCASFLEIFIQKGVKIKGIAKILEINDADFQDNKDLLQEKYGNKFQFTQIIEITPLKIEKIVAPSYFLFPNETNEESQKLSSLEIYKIKI